MGCDGLGAGITRNLRKKLLSVGPAEFFFILGVPRVNEVLMKSLFPMGCEFNGENGDALGSERADAGW